MKQPIMLLLLLLPVISIAQDYFLQNHGPFDADIPSPAEFLGYDIGTQHTRHDRIVSYFEELAQDQEFLQALSNVAIQFFQDDKLFFDLFADGGTMQFGEAMLMTAEEAPEGEAGTGGAEEEAAAGEGEEAAAGEGEEAAAGEGEEAAAGEGEEAAAGEGEEAAAAASLTGVVWQWVSFEDPAEGAQDVGEPERYLLEFLPDGRLNIQADCNSGFGSYSAGESDISISIEGLTLALCPEDSQADAFIQNLEAAVIYVVADGELIMDLPVDSGTMVFAEATLVGNGGAEEGESVAGDVGESEETEVSGEDGAVMTTLFVGPEKVECTGVAPQECLQVRENPEDEYTLFYENIEGFEFEPGYEYELQVEVSEVENPPADASSLQFTLVEVVSKTPVDGGDEAAPAEESAVEGEEAATEDEDMVAEGEDAAAEGEDAAAEGEDAAAEGEDAAAEGEDAAAEGEDAATEAASLAGPIWQWLSLAGGPDGDFDIDAPELYTAQFMDDGRVNIQADCNSGFGVFEMDGDEISITIQGLTLALCPPDSRGDQFVELLEGATSANVAEDDSTLELIGADESVMSFAAEGSSEALVASRASRLGGMDTVAEPVADGGNGGSDDMAEESNDAESSEEAESSDDSQRGYGGGAVAQNGQGAPNGRDGQYGRGPRHTYQVPSFKICAVEQDEMVSIVGKNFPEGELFTVVMSMVPHYRPMNHNGGGPTPYGVGMPEERDHQDRDAEMPAEETETTEESSSESEEVETASVEAADEESSSAAAEENGHSQNGREMESMNGDYQDSWQRPGPMHYGPNRIWSAKFEVGEIVAEESGMIEARFEIPEELAGAYKIKILASTDHMYPYFAYNWFYNTTAEVCNNDYAMEKDNNGSHESNEEPTHSEESDGD